MSQSITKTLTVNSFHQNKLNDHTSFSSSTMKNDTKTTPSQLQFFVRLMWTCKSLVIRASREDTVKSLLKAISFKTKIPIEYQRLIYRGKQLHSEQSLAECCIENDTCLQLIGHLRSMGFPMGCEALDDTVSLILRLCKGESVKDASRILHCRMMKFMEQEECVSVFMFMKVPLLMVTLYNSPYTNNKGIADFCIRQLMIFCDHIETAQLQVIYFEVVLEFCELLRGVGFESNDLLYVVCRGSFGRMLESVGGVSDRDTKRRILFQGGFDCVVEISDKLLRFLDLSLNSPTSQALLCRDVHDFEKFSAPLRVGIADHQAVFEVPLDCGFLCEEDSLIARVVDRFRLVFIQLLSKMDECLQSMEGCLVNKEQGEGGVSVIYYGWYYYLSILKELYHISKLYTGAEDKFWGVLLRRKSMLCHLIVKYTENTDDHRWVLKNRSVTDFESRRHLVMMLFFHELKDGLWDFHEMLIDRSQLLAESFEYISQAKPKSLQSGLFMEFKNEDATGPGVLREWFVLVCQEIFSPQNALFMACPNDRRRFFPNAASKIHPLHLEYFSFCGRIIALALRSKVHVGIVFDRVFHGQLAGKYITLEDIREADPIMYSSCKQILNMDADSIDSDTLGLTFATEVWELGRREVIELCLGGESRVVDSKNREEYVRLLIHNRFVTSISKQVSHFAKGFADILSGSSQEFFQSLELEELDWMLHGSENAISVEDWKAHTVYNGYKDIDRQISWFWEIVGRMSVEQRKVLLFFWTSVKHLPVEGFHGLDSRLHICRTSELDSHLPSSHTCFYELCFPPYSSLAIMQDRLRVITQEHISCSFGTP